MKTGVWRLSNHCFTIRVTVNEKTEIIDAALITKQFIGQPFKNICRWMQHIGKTDIMLLKVIT